MPLTERYIRYVSSNPTISAVPKSGKGRMVTEVTEVTDMSYVTDLGYVLGSAINLPIQALVVGFLSHFVHIWCVRASTVPWRPTPYRDRVARVVW